MYLHCEHRSKNKPKLDTDDELLVCEKFLGCSKYVYLPKMKELNTMSELAELVSATDF